jgi:hypothetical protein
MWPSRATRATASATSGISHGVVFSHESYLDIRLLLYALTFITLDAALPLEVLDRAAHTLCHATLTED